MHECIPDIGSQTFFGEQLVFRPWRIADVNDVHAALQNSGVRQALLMADPCTIAVAEALVIRWAAESYSNSPVIECAVAEAETDAIVAAASIRFSGTRPRVAELGYVVFPLFRHCGYAVDVVRMLTDLGSRDEVEAARAALLVEEKALTRAQDALAAKRRMLPAVVVGKDYRFQTERGEVGLVDLFEGRRQLIVYHYMYEPGSAVGCPGCSMLVDSLGPLAHLHARDTSLVVASRASLPDTAAFRKRMGWEHVPWVSCTEEFARDLGAFTDAGNRPTISFYLREDAEVLHTYTTQDRGGELFMGVYNWLDRTALGRQEEGLDFPQQWWRFHDDYEN